MSWNIEMLHKSSMSNREDGTITVMRKDSLWAAARSLWAWRFLYTGRKPYYPEWTLKIERRAARED
jgi:hypothetical protein